MLVAFVRLGTGYHRMPFVEIPCKNNVFTKYTHTKKRGYTNDIPNWNRLPHEKANAISGNVSSGAMSPFSCGHTHPELVLAAGWGAGVEGCFSA